MKSGITLWSTAATLVAALAMPLGMAAQDTSTPNHHRHHTYRLVDMGTFGGPTSGFNAEGNGGPYINSHGAVGGYAQTTVPLSATANFYECFPGPNVNHTLLWQNGHSLDLGALPPADQNCSGSNSVGINDTGDVAFQSENGVVDPLIGVNEIRAVLWHRGHLTDLGTFGGNASGSSSINNRGQIVGFALNAIPDPYSLYGVFFEGSSNSTQTRAFLWQNGHLRDLGTLGGPDAGTFFINDAGQVAGISYTNSTPNDTTGIPTLDPYIWHNGRMVDMGSLGGTFGLAFAMNNSSQIVGISNLTGDTVSHGYFWDGRRMRDVGTLGGTSSEADSLNDAGEVVGVADFAGDQLHDAFLWRNGRMTDLGNLGVTSHAFSINNQQQIVGNSRVDDTTIHSFLWEDGEMVDLNDLVSPHSDVILTDFETIGDNGEIIGGGLPAGCTDDLACGHAYVLIPNGDCDDHCEQRLSESQRARIAAAQLARVQSSALKPPAHLTPAERVRMMMRQRYHLPGQPAVPRG